MNRLFLTGSTEKLNRIRRKLREKSGFSLTEMLATVMLVGLMGVVISTGVSTIQNTYGKIVRKANEQTLLSTTLVEMRSRLRHSTDVVSVTGEKCPFILSDDGYWFRFVNSADDPKGIEIVYYTVTDDALGKEKLDQVDDFAIVQAPIPLLPPESGEISKIYATFESITYNNGIFTVSDLKVVGADGNGTKLLKSGASYQIAQTALRLGETHE